MSCEVNICHFISKFSIATLSKDPALAILILIALLTCVDTERRGQGALENLKTIGFLRTTGPDPLENHKATQLDLLSLVRYDFLFISMFLFIILIFFN